MKSAEETNTGPNQGERTRSANQSSREYGNLLLLAGIASTSTAVLLIIAKLLAWLASGSVSMLASLVDSLMDSLASLINLLAIRYSLQPADTEHRFGHGKAEALAGLGQAAFITGSSVFLMLQATERLLQPQPLQQTKLGIAVMVFAIVLTAALLVIQKYVIRKTGSTAIHADSLHYLADLGVNASIIVAFMLSNYGYHQLDGILALLISFYILHSAWNIGYQAVQLLLDREISGDVREVIHSIIASHPKAMGFHELRTRQAGATQFIQLHVDMDRDLPLEKAHQLAEEIEHDICARYPNADVIIHLDPVVVTPTVPIKREQ